MQKEHSSKLQPASLNKSRMCRGFRRDGVVQEIQLKRCSKNLSKCSKSTAGQKRFKIFQNLVEIVKKIERFSNREVQQVQTKNNSDSVEPCTVTNANNFNSRSYNVTNSDSSSTKNSFSCQTLIVVVVEEKKRSDNISNSSSTSSKKKSFLLCVKL